MIDDADPIRFVVDDYCIVGTETARDVIAEWMRPSTNREYHLADSLIATLDKNEVRFIAYGELVSLVGDAMDLAELRVALDDRGTP